MPAEPPAAGRFTSVVTHAGPLPAWVRTLAEALGRASGGLAPLPVVGRAVAAASEPAAEASWSVRLDGWRGARARSLAAAGMLDPAGVPPDPATGLTLWLAEPPAPCAGTGWALRVGDRPAAAMSAAVLTALDAGAGEIVIEAVPIGRRADPVPGRRWHCALSEHSYARSVDWVAEKLVALARRLPAGAADHADADDRGRPPWPGPPPKSGVHHALERAARQVLAREQWSIRVHPDVGTQTLAPHGPFVDLIPPPDRYWADPFLARRDGRLWVFFEELRVGHPHGRLCAVAIEDGHRHSTPVTVLERPGHLSYPNVFEHAGSWYLLPESADQRQLVLYRAKHWPDDWEPVARLLEDERLVDPTLLQRGGRWWLVGAGADTAEGSVRDALCLYSAAALTGPFRAVAHNPVRVDAANARPAGPCFEWQGRWHRPVQDCRGRYGRAVHVMRIDELGPEGLRETRIATLAADPRGGTQGVHTYCRHGGALAIDWLRWRARWPALPTPSAPSLVFTTAG